MRLMAPAIGGAAVVLAAALVAYFRPGSEPPLAPESEALPAQPVTAANEPSAVAPDAETPAVVAPPATQTPAAGSAGAAPAIERAPLPGEIPVTPMTNLMVGRTGDAPPAPLVEGERAFGAEPVDRAWAPGAEADILSKFAQIPGLKLIDLQVECRSTMCRLQFMQTSGVQNGARSFKELIDAAGLEPRWMMTIKEPGNAPIKSAAYLWREGLAPQKPELATRHETN